jgi:hypothetical protein
MGLIVNEQVFLELDYINSQTRIYHFRLNRMGAEVIFSGGFFASLSSLLLVEKI